MSWRDQLLWADYIDKVHKKASFRDASFYIRDTSTSIGRRNVVHQYPYKEEAYIEDLGLDIDEFTIEGYVIQNKENDYDYFKERDALILALKESGTGILSHPFLGEKEVSVVGKSNITESFTEGGIARFTMTFTLAAEKEIPTEVNHPDAVATAYDNAMDDTVDGFYGIYDSDDMPGYSASSVMSAIGKLNTMLISTMGAIRSLGPAQMSRALAHLTKEYAAIDLAAVGQTCSLANSVIGMFNGLSSLSGLYGDIVVSHLFGACSSAIRGISQGPMSGAQVGLPSTGFMASTTSTPALIDEELGKSVVEATLAIADYGKDTGNIDPSEYGGDLPAVIVTSATTAQQAANQVALVNLARNTAIALAAKMGILINYTSYDSVMDILDKIIAVLDAQLLKLGNDSANTNYANYNISIADSLSYNALESLRPVIVNAMIGVGATLARIVDYTVPPVTLSSLVLAYNKYEDLNREQEIIGRNPTLINHPGFLPGGQNLEILSE